MKQIYKYLQSFMYNRLYLIKISKKSFWQKFFITTIAFIVLLSSISIFGFNVINRITKPIKYLGDNKVIVYVTSSSNKVETENRVAIIRDYLKNNNYIKSFNELSKNEILSIMDSWIKSYNQELFIDLPSIFVVKLNNAKLFSASELQLAMNDLIQDVFVETEKASISRLASNSLTVQSVNFIAFVISFFIFIFMISLLTIALVFANKQSIEILHLFGASNKSISLNFALFAMINSIKGSFIGVILAIFIAFIISIMFSFINVFSFMLGMMYVFFSMPILAGISSFIVAMITTKRVLKWVVML